MANQTPSHNLSSPFSTPLPVPQSFQGMGSQTEPHRRPAPVQGARGSAPGVIKRGIEALGRYAKNFAGPSISDDLESGTDVTNYSRSLMTLMDNRGQTTETLNEVEIQVKDALERYGIAPEGVEDEGVQINYSTPIGSPKADAPAPPEYQPDPTDAALEVYPHPDTLPLDDYVKRMLPYEQLTYHLGMVQPSSLLSCGNRVLQTQVGDVEFTPYCQYVIRVLSVYYSNIPLVEDYACVFNVAHYCHSASVGKKDEHAVSFEDVRTRALNYGISFLLTQMAKILIAPVYLESPAKVMNTTEDYRRLIIGEIKARYPDLMVIVKMTYFLSSPSMSVLDPYLEAVRYNPDYELYLAEVCRGGAILDNVPVGVTPKCYDPPPSSSTANQKASASGVSQAPAGSAQAPAAAQRPKPTPYMRSDRFGAPVDRSDRAKEKVIYNQADLGRNTIIRDSSGFRKGVDDLTAILQWMGAAEIRFKAIEANIDIITASLAGVEDKVAEVDASLAQVQAMVQGRTLAGQQQINEALLRTAGPQANIAVPPPGVSAPLAFAGAPIRPAERVDYKEQALRDLKNYDRVVDKKKLVETIEQAFQVAGKPELAINLSVETLARAMTRTRILQSLSIL